MIEFAFTGRQRHGAEIDLFAQIPCGHVPDEPTGSLGVDDRVLAPPIRVLIGREHHHGRIEGQVLLLAVRGDVLDPRGADRGQPSDRSGNGATLEWRKGQRARFEVRGIFHVWGVLG